MFGSVDVEVTTAPLAPHVPTSVIVTVTAAQVGPPAAPVVSGDVAALVGATAGLLLGDETAMVVAAEGVGGVAEAPGIEVGELGMVEVEGLVFGEVEAMGDGLGVEATGELGLGVVATGGLDVGVGATDEVGFTVVEVVSSAGAGTTLREEQ